MKWNSFTSDKMSELEFPVLLIDMTKTVAYFPNKEALEKELMCQTIGITSPKVYVCWAHVTLPEGM